MKRLMGVVELRRRGKEGVSGGCYVVWPTARRNKEDVGYGAALTWRNREANIGCCL